MNEKRTPTESVPEGERPPAAGTKPRKRLERSRDDRYIGGVAAGIATYLGIDPILIRLAFVASILVGGIGVSGDGIDQDDMISFLGTHNASVRVGGINNAAPEIRADRITVNVGGTDVRLRYVSCPFAPFLDTDENNVCQGL